MLAKGRNLSRVRQNVERVKALPSASLAASVLGRAAADCRKAEHWPDIEAFIESRYASSGAIYRDWILMSIETVSNVLWRDDQMATFCPFINGLYERSQPAL